MTKPWISLCGGIALCCAATSFTFAQTVAPPAVAPPAAGDVGSPTVQQSTGGITYISGGAGEEERTAMDARRGEFPLKVVLSAGSGEYIVAEKLSLIAAQGAVLVVRDAGPVVMIKAPPGAYTVEAVYQGKTERRTLPAGGAQNVGFRFPG